MKKINFLLKNIFCLSFLMLCFSCSKPGDSLVNQAIDSFQKGEYENSIELFNQALQSETRYSDEFIFNLLSNVYAAQDDFETSAFYLEKSLSKKSDYRGFCTLGMNYQTLKQFDKAEENYFKAVQMNPEKGEAYASLGILYLEQNEDSKALEYLLKGAEYAPKIAVIHANLAVVYAKLGQTDKIATELKLAEELQCVNLGQFEDKIQNILSKSKQ